MPSKKVPQPRGFRGGAPPGADRPWYCDSVHVYKARIIVLGLSALAIGCTGISYHHGRGRVDIDAMQKSGGGTVASTWRQEDVPTNTLRGVDHSGAFCAGLAGIATNFNAHEAAFRNAVDEGSSSYSFKWQSFTAR